MENGKIHGVCDLFDLNFGCESSSLLEFTENQYTRNDVFTGGVKPQREEEPTAEGRWGAVLNERGKKMCIWGLRFTVQLEN